MKKMQKESRINAGRVAEAAFAADAKKGLKRRNGTKWMETLFGVTKLLNKKKLQTSKKWYLAKLLEKQKEFEEKLHKIKSNTRGTLNNSIEGLEKFDREQELLRAGKFGYTPAQNDCGIMYYERGNEKYAERHFEEAADQGNKEAQYNLLKLWSFRSNRDRVKQSSKLECKKSDANMQDALVWLEERSDKGNSFAQTNLGILCYEKRDLVGAKRWWIHAAWQKNEYAQHYLGIIYLEEDLEEAKKWFKEAAKQGCCEARHNLSSLSKGCFDELIKKNPY